MFDNDRQYDTDPAAENPPDPGLQEAQAEVDAEEHDVQQALDDQTLLTEITAVLNRHSRENRSNTPDLVLAAFIMSALDAAERLIATRDVWYGIAPAPGRPRQTAPTDLDDDGLQYRLWSLKHGGYWRPDDEGYTSDPVDAGTFTRSEALKRVAQSALSARLELVTCMVVVTPAEAALLDADRAARRGRPS